MPHMSAFTSGTAAPEHVRQGGHRLIDQRVPCCAETALSRLNQRSLERVFAVNAFGPILVSKVRDWSSII